MAIHSSLLPTSIWSVAHHGRSTRAASLWPCVVSLVCGPRFPGFGVGRGFAIWDPFPVQAPDKAPETCTWSTRSEGGANLLSRNLDGNQIAWKYRRCAGHANLLFRDGVKRQVGKCDCLLEFTTRPELSQSRARIWPQQHVPKRLKNSATRNSTARSQNRRLAICMA